MDGRGVWQGGGEAHKHEAIYVDRPVTLLTDVDTPEDFAALQSGEA